MASMAQAIPSYSNWSGASASSIKIEEKILMKDQVTEDIYEVFVRNGELVCQAQDLDIRREDRFKKLLDE